MRLAAVFLTFVASSAVACGSSGDAVVSHATEVVEEVVVNTRTPVPTLSGNTPVPTITPRPTVPPQPTRVPPAPSPTPVVVAGWNPHAFQIPATPTERFNLSQLDAAGTEAKLAELLLDGWVMYQRQSVFNARNPLGLDIDLRAIIGRTPAEIVRLDYPETTLFDTWISAESSDESTWLTYELTTDGDLLNAPVRLADSVARVDIATGIIMEPDISLRRERAVNETVAAQFTAIERNREAGRSEILREYLGRPSVIFGDTFEYQIANPFIQHQIREQTEDDGSVTLLSEFHTLDFAMFPPGSMPEIPSWPPN